MMQRILVKPKHGLHVRDPKTGLALPPEGKVLEKRSFWLRRQNEGSVTIQAVSDPSVKDQKLKSKKG